MIDRHAVARAQAATFIELCSHIDGGWSRRVGPLTVAFTGTEVASLNTVYTDPSGSTPRDLATALEIAGAAGLPFGVQVAHEPDPVLTGLLESYGLVRGADLPVMTAARPTATGVGGLEVRRLELSERWMHLDLVADAFGLDVRVVDRLVPSSLMTSAGVDVWAGFVGGRAVTTAFSCTHGRAVGIFDVATPPEHERRGYGTAVTAAALAAGLDGGAEFAWLESSPSGRPVYERLGFCAEDRPRWLLERAGRRPR